MNFIYVLYFSLFIISFISMTFLHYNLFINLVYLELSALSISVILLIASIQCDDQYLEFLVVIFITLVGAESAIAISLFIGVNRLGLALTSSELSKLKGLKNVQYYYCWSGFYVFDP